MLEFLAKLSPSFCSFLPLLTPSNIFSFFQIWGRYPPADEYIDLS